MVGEDAEGVSVLELSTAVAALGVDEITGEVLEKFKSSVAAIGGDAQVVILVRAGIVKGQEGSGARALAERIISIIKTDAPGAHIVVSKRPGQLEIGVAGERHEVEVAGILRVDQARLGIDGGAVQFAILAEAIVMGGLDAEIGRAH